MRRANSLSKRALKRLLPPTAIRGARSVYNYIGRLGVWLRVAAIATGYAPADSQVLRSSLTRAPADMLRDLDGWRDLRLMKDADIRIKNFGIFAIRGDSDDLGHVLPFAHTRLFGAIRAVVRRGDVVVDAGANIGAVTVLLAKQVGEQGTVIAVEMMEETARRLRRNIELNGLTCVTVVETALASLSGATVVAEVAEGFFGQASIAGGANQGRSVRRVDVKTRTLDELTAHFDRIALMKMDLEGAEADALAGATRMLKHTDAVIFESWAADGGATARRLVQAGFRISPIDGRNFLATRSAS